jgi:type II secretory pathway pseudopilin PulG
MTGKTRRPSRHRPLHGGSVGTGFTLVELLVVISIFILLMALAIPAFSTMLYSTEQAMASNSLRIALSGARDAALRSSSGTDAAAVFAFDPGGRLTILPCVKATAAYDQDSGAQRKIIRRDVFVPLPTVEPVQLPRNWMVRGYTPPNSVTDEWYESTYPDTASRGRGNWIFPESGFYDTGSGSAGFKRQTFMVRFEGGTGALSLSNPVTSLVLLPSPGAFRTASPWSLPGMRVDRESDQARFARRVVEAPGSALSLAQKISLLGDVSSDTALVKPVGQLAVYNESRLAGAVGGRVDPATGSLYQAPGPANQFGPAMVTTAGGPVDTRTINEWIEGRLRVGTVDIPSDARIFSIQHYLGGLQELTGSRP